MTKLQAKVLQPMQLTRQGVTQYMVVQAEGAGQVTVIPSPSYSNIAAQLIAKPGDSCKIDAFGKLEQMACGILLDPAGNQFGQPVSYAANDIMYKPQMFWVGNDGLCKRGSFIPGRDAVRNAIDITIAGVKIPIRYGHLISNPGVNTLRDWQGFVYNVPGSSPVAHKMWFELTAGTFKEASTNPKFNGVMDSFANQMRFSFIGSAKFDESVLSGVKESAAKRYAMLRFEYESSVKGKPDSIQVEIEPGRYDLERLLAMIPTLPGGNVSLRQVMDLYAGHVVRGNKPLNLTQPGGKNPGSAQQVSKKTELSFEAGHTYGFSLYQPPVEQYEVRRQSSPTPAQTGRGTTPAQPQPPTARPQQPAARPQTTASGTGTASSSSTATRPAAAPSQALPASKPMPQREQRQEKRRELAPAANGG
jgi:hypothetical protein